VGVHHAAHADGCQRDRHGDVLADHLRGDAAALEVHRHALAQSDRLEIRVVRAQRALGPGAGLDVVDEHARNAAMRDRAQVFDAGDDGHAGLGGLERRNSTAASSPGPAAAQPWPLADWSLFSYAEGCELFIDWTSTGLVLRASSRLLS